MAGASVNVFQDARVLDTCLFCGDAFSSELKPTKEHVPSRILLDEPRPAQHPTVRACKNCNEAFSRDEMYLACLLECVIAGSAELEAMERAKVRAALAQDRALHQKLRDARTVVDGVPHFQFDEAGVVRVLEKLARGHLLHDVGLQIPVDESAEVVLTASPLMSPQARDDFYKSQNFFGESLLPEIGSRAFIDLIESPDASGGTSVQSWKVVQEERYEYKIDLSPEATCVRLLIRGYLASVVYWEE